MDGKNTFELETYIFGSSRTVIVKTDATLKELTNNWDLREKLILERISEDMHVQDSIEQL